VPSEFPVMALDIVFQQHSLMQGWAFTSY